ncbi:hypothetical protein WDW86_14410 [Bdellovibrionota bacterium FG-2]
MRTTEVELRRHTSASPWTYAMMDARQRVIAARALAGGPGGLLISEVAPVITLGRRTGPGDVVLPESVLREKGVDLHPIDRGGMATYHGPGQWVVFAVDTLERLTGDRRGVRKAVDALLDVGLEVGLSYEPSAHVRDGTEVGVWTEKGKFAACGVHIVDGVLLHGLAINAFRTETSFLGIRPCGSDKPVVFLLQDPSEHAFLEMAHRIEKAVFARFWEQGSLVKMGAGSMSAS